MSNTSNYTHGSIHRYTHHGADYNNYSNINFTSVTVNFTIRKIIEE